MQSRWVDRDAKAAVDRYAAAGISPELALRVYTTRLLGGDPKLVLHGGGNTSVKTRMPDLRRRGRGAVRQGLRLGHGARSSPPACRRCGSRRCSSCGARRALRRRHGARAARQPARSDGAQPVGRDAAARLPAAQVRRPHPRQRGAQPDRPAERREAVPGGLWRRAWASCPTSCRASGSPRPPPTMFERESEGRRADPRQARHLHLRRKRARSLRAHDRDGHARRERGCRRTARRCSSARSCRSRCRRTTTSRRSCAARAA